MATTPCLMRLIARGRDAVRQWFGFDGIDVLVEYEFTVFTGRANTP